MLDNHQSFTFQLSVNEQLQNELLTAQSGSFLFWCAQSSMTKEGRVCNLAGVSTGMDVVGGVPHEETTATHMQVANVM